MYVSHPSQYGFLFILQCVQYFSYCPAVQFGIVLFLRRNPVPNSNLADWETNSQSCIHESNTDAAAIMPGLKPARSVFYFLALLNLSEDLLVNIWLWIS